MSETPRNAPDDLDPFLSEIQSAKVRAELKRLAARAHIVPDDREDIVSDTIAAASRNRSTYDPRRASVTMWVLGVGKKVIATYLRKRQTQKRNPDEGLVSLDVSPNENGDTRFEPADAAAQKRHEASEQVQHYIEAAKLSEKEAKAMARRLDKESQDSGKKFSSSTNRRALKKLKQIASDDKFRQHPQGPDASECAHGSVPAAEGSAAVLFDQARRTPWFVESITKWRKSPQWNNARAFLRNQKDLKRFPLRIPVQYWSEELRRYREAAYNYSKPLYGRFEAAVEINAYFPRMAEGWLLQT